MDGARRVPEATELVYAPAPSWVPLFFAAGLATVVVGLFAGMVWAIIGAVVVLVALVRWWRTVADEISRMPRSQRVTTAVLPPIPPRQG
jgi:hypothetical protein